MTVGTLIHPDNRLLGWSTGNLSQYGALPTVTVGAASALVPDDPFVSIPATSASPADEPAESGAPTVIAAAIKSLMGSMPDQATLPAGVSAGPAPTLAPAVGMGTDPTVASYAPLVPAPSGSGSIAPIAVACPLTLSPTSLSGTTPAGSSDLTSATFSVPTLSIVDAASAQISGLANLAPAMSPSFLAVRPLDGVLDLGTGALGAIDGVVTTTDVLVQQSTALLDDLASTIAPLGAALSGGLAVSAAPVLDALSAAATLVPVATIAAATAELGSTAAAATSVLDALVAAPVGDLANVAPSFAEPVLAGVDPAGGVTTLVEMVESADLFDLSQAGADAAPVTAGGSILDTLTADTPISPLLGEAADHDSGDGGSLIDHHLGVLGGL